jgi:hypothetical protein
LSFVCSQESFGKASQQIRDQDRLIRGLYAHIEELKHRMPLLSETPMFDPLSMDYHDDEDGTFQIEEISSPPVHLEMPANYPIYGPAGRSQAQIAEMSSHVEHNQQTSRSKHSQYHQQSSSSIQHPQPHQPHPPSQQPSSSSSSAVRHHFFHQQQSTPPPQLSSGQKRGASSSSTQSSEKPSRQTPQQQLSANTTTVAPNTSVIHQPSQPPIRTSIDDSTESHLHRSENANPQVDSVTQPQDRKSPTEEYGDDFDR